MDADTRRALLDVHIPYRMRHVDGLRWACEVLQEAGPSWVEVCAAGTLHRAGIRLLTNPLVETGAIAGRVLLGFMGIALDQNDALTPARCRDDDITMASFGRDPLRPEEIERRGSAEVAACIRLLKIANKGIAHLTFKDPEPDDIPVLQLAAVLIPRLLCDALYHRLQHPVPEFRFPGVA